MSKQVVWWILASGMILGCSADSRESSENPKYQAAEQISVSITSGMAPNVSEGRLSYLVGGDRIRLELGSNRREQAPTTIASSSNFFANWTDVPAVTEAGDGSWIAHWLEVSGPETYDYGAKVAWSVDQGQSWSELGWLNDDAWGVGESATVAGEHGFVSWVPEGEGARSFWLDGRAAVGHSEDGVGAMQLRTTMIVDGVIHPSEVIDDRVCDCCPTAAVATPNGALVAFRDRTEEEIRDIHLLRQTADGWSRTEIDTSGWQIAGCPVNGPALAAEGNLVLLAWFSGHPEPTIYAAWSIDGGLTFESPVRLTSDTLGRVTAAISGSRGYVGWLSQTQSLMKEKAGPVGGGEIRVVRIEPDGRVGSVVGLVQTAASRRAGIPRLVGLDQRLGLAWTEVTADEEGALSTNVRYQEFTPPE